MFLFKKVGRLFSGQPKPGAADLCGPRGGYAPDSEYHGRIAELERQIEESKKRIAECRNGIDRDAMLADGDFDIDEYEDYIDELETRLDDCDDLSGGYDVMDDIDVSYGWNDAYDDHCGAGYDSDDDW